MAIFPTVRGSAIDAHSWSAGDTRNPFQIIELEMVARAGIEPATRRFSVAAKVVRFDRLTLLGEARLAPVVVHAAFAHVALELR